MSRLILKGDTISNFGKRFPVPYISRIEISSFKEESKLFTETGLEFTEDRFANATRLKIEINLLFNESDNFMTNEVIERIFNEMHLNLFLSKDSETTGKLITKKKYLKSILIDEYTSIYAHGHAPITVAPDPAVPPLDFAPGIPDVTVPAPPDPGAEVLMGSPPESELSSIVDFYVHPDSSRSININMLEAQSNNTSVFEESNFLMYCYPLNSFKENISFDSDFDDDMNKIIKSNVIELDLLVPDFDTTSHLTLFAGLSVGHPSDLENQSVVSFGLNYSDLAYEFVLRSGVVAIINSEGYVEKRTQAFYTGNVLRALNKKYYKSIDYGGEEIVSNLRSVIEDYQKYRDEKPEVNDGIANLEYQIARYQDNIDFLERLNDYIKVFPEKSPETKAGQMYERIRRSVENSNTLVKQQAEVEKRLIRNVKIRDLRPLQFEQVFVPSYDSSLDVDDFLYGTVIQTSLAKFQPGGATKWKTELEYDSEEYTEAVLTTLKQLAEDYGFYGDFSMEKGSHVNVLNHANNKLGDRGVHFLESNIAHITYYATLIYWHFWFTPWAEPKFRRNPAGGSQGYSADGTKINNEWENDLGRVMDDLYESSLGLSINNDGEISHRSGYSTEAEDKWKYDTCNYCNSYGQQRMCAMCGAWEAYSRLEGGITPTHVLQRDVVNSGKSYGYVDTVNGHNRTFQNNSGTQQFLGLVEYLRRYTWAHSTSAHRRYNVSMGETGGTDSTNRSWTDNEGNSTYGAETYYAQTRDGLRSDNYHPEDYEGVNAKADFADGPWAIVDSSGGNVLESEAQFLNYQVQCLIPAAKSVLEKYVGVVWQDAGASSWQTVGQSVAPGSPGYHSDGLQGKIGRWFRDSTKFSQAISFAFEGGRPSDEQMFDLINGSLSSVDREARLVARKFALNASVHFLQTVKENVERHFGTTPVYKMRAGYDYYNAVSADCTSWTVDGWYCLKPDYCSTGCRSVVAQHAFPWLHTLGMMEVNDKYGHPQGLNTAHRGEGGLTDVVPYGNPGAYNTWGWNVHRRPGFGPNNANHIHGHSVSWGGTSYDFEYYEYDYHRRCPEPQIGFGITKSYDGGLFGYVTAFAGRGDYKVSLPDQIREYISNLGYGPEDTMSSELMGALHGYGSGGSGIGGGSYALENVDAVGGSWLGEVDAIYTNYDEPLLEFLEKLMFEKTGFPRNSHKCQTESMTDGDKCPGCPPEIWHYNFGNQILIYAMEVLATAGYDALYNYFYDATRILLLYHGFTIDESEVDKLANVDIVVKKYGWYFYDMEKYVRKQSNVSSILDVDKFISYFPNANDVLNFTISIDETAMTHFRTDMIGDNSVQGINAHTPELSIKDEGYDMYMSTKFNAGYQPKSHEFIGKTPSNDFSYDDWSSTLSADESKWDLPLAKYKGRPPWPSVKLLDVSSWADFDADIDAEATFSGINKERVFSYVALRNVDLGWVSSETTDLDDLAEATDTVHLEGASGATPAIPNNYRLACFNYNWYVDDDLTGFAGTQDHYNLQVKIKDTSGELIPAFSLMFNAIYNDFVENYYNLAIENCTFNRFTSQFNDFFSTNMNEVYGDNLIYAPWFRAPAVWAVFRDLFTDAYNGDIDLMFEDARRMSDIINPTTGFLDALINFKGQMETFADVLEEAVALYDTYLDSSYTVYSMHRGHSVSLYGTGPGGAQTAPYYGAFSLQYGSFEQYAHLDGESIPVTDDAPILSSQKVFSQFNIVVDDTVIGYVSRTGEEVMSEFGDFDRGFGSFVTAETDGVPPLGIGD